MKKIILFLLPIIACAQSTPQQGPVYLTNSPTRVTVSAVPTVPIEHHLVDLTTLNPAPLLEIRYATEYNFTGEQLYPFPRAWLHEKAAKALQEVQIDLAQQGLGLKVYDGYRPLSVQRKMWNLIHDARYVSNPDVSRGRHTRGTAVDVTLVDKVGNELPMPTGFDDFTARAHRNYSDLTPKQKKDSKLLEAVMKKHGFDSFPFEWWHFDFHDWQNYPPLDISFQDLTDGKRMTMPVP